MTTKKKYMKPALQVFELKQTGILMTSGQGQAGVQNYNWNEEVTE